MLGLPAAVVLAVVVAAAGGGAGVADIYFVAAAVLTPMLALGLLVQVVTAMTRNTRALMGEVTRFEEEMAAQPPALSEETQRVREQTTAAARRFVHAFVPFAAGLGVQLVVTEAVAIYCVAAGVQDRAIAVGLGVEILALLGYLLLFGPLLARFSSE